MTGTQRIDGYIVCATRDRNGTPTELGVRLPDRVTSYSPDKFLVLIEEVIGLLRSGVRLAIDSTNLVITADNLEAVSGGKAQNPDHRSLALALTHLPHSMDYLTARPRVDRFTDLLGEDSYPPCDSLSVF